MQIVLAQPDQADAVRRCVVAAYGHYIERLGTPPAPMLDDYDELIRRQVVHLAVDHDDLLGLIVMWAEADHVYIDNLAVHPAAQARGIGSELLVAAQRAARAAGRHELRLYTHALMTENLAYYCRRGFSETHRARHQGYDRVFLVRVVARVDGRVGGVSVGARVVVRGPAKLRSAS